MKVKLGIRPQVVLKPIYGYRLYKDHIYGYRLYNDQLIDTGCVKINLWIQVVLRLMYEYRLYEDPFMDTGCIKINLWIQVV